jgi:predicted flavoprotein YhiN
VGMKQVGREINQSPPSNVKLKNAWSHTSIVTHNLSFNCVKVSVAKGRELCNDRVANRLTF